MAVLLGLELALLLRHVLHEHAVLVAADLVALHHRAVVGHAHLVVEKIKMLAHVIPAFFGVLTRVFWVFQDVFWCFKAFLYSYKKEKTFLHQMGFEPTHI